MVVYLHYKQRIKQQQKIINTMIIEKGLPDTKILLEKFEDMVLLEILNAAKIHFNDLIAEKINYKDWEHNEIEHNFIDFIDEILEELE